MIQTTEGEIMKGFLLGGLAFALGSVLISANAQEIQWRPQGAKDSAPPAFQPIRNSDGQRKATPIKVGLLPPSPINRTPSVITDSQVTPVSLFQPAKMELEEPIVKAQSDPENLKPLPSGPVLETAPVQKGAEPPKNQSFEAAPMPKPLPDYQGVEIPPGAGPVVIHSDGPVFGPLPGDGYMVDGGEFICEDGWASSFCGFPRCSTPRFYASAEYLLWGLSDPNLPPLVTTTNLSVAEAIALVPLGVTPGAIGNRGTDVLFGGDNFDSATFSGGRFTLGYSKLSHDCALEGTFFFLGEASTDFAAASNAANPQFLFLPFFNTDPANMGEDVLPVASVNPAGFNRVTARYASRMWGAEVNLRKPWCCDCNSKLDFLAGFRFIELTESLDLECCFDSTGTLSSIDSFGTRNRFFGGQIGADYEHRHGRWILGATGKLAIGGIHQRVRIDGSSFTNLTTGEPAPMRVGNFFTGPSNIGRYSQDELAVVPEVQLKLGYQITDNLSAYVAYNFLYISSVARPGDQIDRSFDPRTSVTGPMFVFQDTDFWAQGVNFGVNWKY
jgi:hypothetical protein